MACPTPNENPRQITPISVLLFLSLPYAQSSGIANASKSVPMLLTPPPVSGLGSRRQSTCSISSLSLGGKDSRRSSVASIGNTLGSYKSHRRPSALISNSSSGNLLQQLSAGVGPEEAVRGALPAKVECVHLRGHSGGEARVICLQRSCNILPTYFIQQGISRFFGKPLVF
ncbi:hypothetical protein SK128_003760 [Halocaridina rubra]|uniref:Uncharacterized protein n=1 Tax=Halocaridina rubra TaxID=373956 RepID=A0AAN9A9E0_HALRR